jgi:phosphatidylserine decarboxylase
VKEIIINNNHIHVIIYLSLLDSHTQHYPINSKIINQIYDDTGKYEIDYKIEKSNDNNKFITKLQTKYGNIIIKQIAGKYVRSIQVDDSINDHGVSGDIMGMIKFGSRVDIIIPKQHFNLLINKNTFVTPNTIIGHFENMD